MRRDLHMTPTFLLDTLQKKIDLIESGNDLHTNENRFGDMEAILLGYGLCSNAFKAPYALNLLFNMGIIF